MKKLLFLGLIAFGFNNLSAQELKLHSEAIEFGDVNLNTEVSSVLKVTNTGNADLIIKSVVGSCGCTVPEFPKTPIAPGKTADIKVNYSVGPTAGTFNKTVTISSNDINSSRKIFRVKGNAK